MNCQEARDLIHAHADGELGLVNTLEVEKHILNCSECSRAHQALIALRSSLSDDSLYFRTPPSLERKIRIQIKKARASAGGGSLPFIGFNRWVGAAAALVLIATGLWIGVRAMDGRTEGLLASEVTAAHIRSLMLTEHLWDVKSTDQHTVKPWFDGKVDFAPEVRDFKSDSFALEGGRLDYLGNHPVAALVYRHDKHYINLFIWPAAGKEDQGRSVTTRQGYVLVHWIDSGMNYWAVSDMSQDGLERFARLFVSPGSALLSQ